MGTAMAMGMATKTKNRAPTVLRQIKEQTHDLGLRLLVGVLLAGLAVAAFSNARGNVELMANPERAYGQLGWGGFPAGRIADQVAIEQPDATGLAQAARLAHISLAAQGLNAQALRVLGIAADKRGDEAQALAFMTLSDHLSRRDLGTQVWLVNHHAALNNADESLRHYDTVLRASNDIQPVLFPILQRALADPGIRKAFAPYIRGGAPWLPNFIAFQISSSADASNVANAIIDAGGLPAQPDLYRGLEGQLLAQLEDTRHFDVLRAFFLHLGGARAEALTNAGFTAASTDPRFAPLTWTGSEAATIASAFEDDPAPGMLAFHVIAGSGQNGVAGTKLVLLPPGHYRISATVNVLHRGTGSALSWGVKCASTGTDLALTDVGRAMQLSAVEFDVTAACPAQQLTLIVSGGDAADGTELYADQVSLTRRGDPIPPKPAPQPSSAPTASRPT